MSARPGPGGGYRATGIPTAIHQLWKPHVARFGKELRLPSTRHQNQAVLICFQSVPKRGKLDEERVLSS